MKKDFDPRFGKHDPQETPLGKATEALLEKMHKRITILFKKNNQEKSLYDFDPRFGRHDPRNSPLGRSADALLEKMRKQYSDQNPVSGDNKPQKKS